MQGNIGKGIVKVSSVEKKYWKIKAPALVFNNQTEFYNAYKDGALHKDCVVVVRGQGPKSNGMPELHSLSPTLSVLQNLGYKIALITDGRMSGASGSVLSIVHIYPEAAENGLISQIKDSDIIEIDVNTKTFNVKQNNKNQLVKNYISPEEYKCGYGRELFRNNRAQVTNSENGAISIG